MNIATTITETSLFTSYPSSASNMLPKRGKSGVGTKTNKRTNGPVNAHLIPGPRISEWYLEKDKGT